MTLVNEIEVLCRLAYFFLMPETLDVVIAGQSDSKNNNNPLFTHLYTRKQVLPRFELGSLDSKSRVLTITP